jgi:hypothetical protein
VVTVRRLLPSVLAWTVGAVAAVGVGMLAVSLIGDGLSTRTGQPLTSDAIARESPSASAPRQSPPSVSVSAGRETGSKLAPSTRSTGPPTPAARPISRPITTSGGTAIVRCTGGLAYLVSWSPREGYTYDNVDRGPAQRVRVRFRSDEDKVDIRVTCPQGVPRAEVDSDD